MTAPNVSVVVVNYNGQHHLEACFASLLRQDYPADHVELILVDNASTDGSLHFMAERFPQVQIITNATNIGFAPAVNQGATTANGEYLALINNDAYADPSWITAMVATLSAHRHAEVVCISARMLDWQGRRIDFVGGGINFYGMGDQFFHGLPITAVEIGPDEVLFACGGAMLVDRAVFLDLGGFDPDYFAYFEDVDFGWRLWLAGYRVRYTPEAIVYHREHATSGRMPWYRVNTLLERNALYTIIKNYDDEHLNRLLAPALLLLIKRSLSESLQTIDRHEFELQTAEPHAYDAIGLPRMAVSYLVALGDLLEDFPAVWQRRQAVQARRRRPDAEIMPLFRRPMSGSYNRWEYLLFQQQLTEALGVREMFGNLPTTRVVIISSDPLSVHLAGPGIRAVEMARYLAQHCHVTLAAPDEAAITIPGVVCVAFERGDSPTVRQLALQSDVVILQGFTLHNYPVLKELNRPLVIDLYDPFHLENLEIHGQHGLGHAREATRFDLEVINDQLTSGDFFICASERQRDFWLGALGTLGRLAPEVHGQDPSFRSLIDIVPFGLPPVPPAQTAHVLKGIVPGIALTDTVLLWGGGIWDWLDPLTLIRAMAVVGRERQDIKLFFLGWTHPNAHDVNVMTMGERSIALARELGLLDQTVFFNDRWVSYDERQNYLLEADIGVSAHFDHVETRLAFRTRLLDYMWASLPMIVTNGDVGAETVREHGLGLTVGVEDIDGWVQSILRLAGECGRPAYAEAFTRVQARFAWPTALAPLIRFCQQPRYAPDRRPYVPTPTAVLQPLVSSELEQHMVALTATIEQKNAHIARLEELLARVEQGRVLRLLKLLRRLRGRQQ